MAFAPALGVGPTNPRLFLVDYQEPIGTRLGAPPPSTYNHHLVLHPLRNSPPAPSLPAVQRPASGASPTAPMPLKSRSLPAAPHRWPLPVSPATFGRRQQPTFNYKTPTKSPLASCESPAGAPSLGIPSASVPSSAAEVPTTRGHKRPVPAVDQASAYGSDGSDDGSGSSDSRKRRSDEETLDGESGGRRRHARAQRFRNFSCKGCGSTSTPETRAGPDGKRSLCNRCGLQYSKQKRLEESVRGKMAIRSLLNDDETAPSPQLISSAPHLR